MIKILLVEDDLDDIELLQHALLSQRVNHTMKAIHDGAKAIEYIRTCGDCPDIIILDFNLPKVHGREIILEIKSLANFKAIPLLILTTSSAQSDKDYAYANGADKYLVKPTEIEQINDLVSTIVSLATTKQ